MSLRARVKICGIIRPEDAIAAADAGADALGFVFYERSPRYIDTTVANNIINKLPPFINKVALFVNPKSDFVSRVTNELNIDTLQFHGDEDEVFCASFGKPYLKAVRVQGASDINDAADTYHSACGLLVDAYDSAQYGGTGQTFNWGWVPKSCALPIIVAGGLNVSNVGSAIDKTKPYAVDVSSGVEKGKGVKDHALIKQFMNEVKRAND